MNCKLTDTRGLSDASLSYLMDRIADDPVIDELRRNEDRRRGDEQRAADVFTFVVARILAISLSSGIVDPPIFQPPADVTRIR